MSNKTRLWLYGLLAAVLMMGAMSAMSRVSAQPPTTPTPTAAVEIVGTIESVASGTIVVAGNTINVSKAEVKVALTVGTLVKIEGTLAADGSIQAREVKAAKAGTQTTAIEITGRVESIDGSKITVGGKTFDISKAEVEVKLAVGATVKIEAVFVNGVWIAREVGAEDRRLRLRMDDDDDTLDDDDDNSGPGGGDDESDDDDDDDDDSNDDDDDSDDDHGGDDSGSDDHGGDDDD